MNMSGNAIRYEQDTASFCVRDAIVKSIWSRLHILRVVFLLIVYQTDQKIKRIWN